MPEGAGVLRWQSNGPLPAKRLFSGAAADDGHANALMLRQYQKLNRLSEAAMQRNEYDVTAACIAVACGCLIALNSPVAAQEVSTPALVLAVSIGAAVSSWLVFPALGKRVGLSGVARDTLLILLAVALAGAISGTLVLPIFGTIAGVVVAFRTPMVVPWLGLVYVFGGLTALILARLKRTG